MKPEIVIKFVEVLLPHFVKKLISLNVDYEKIEIKLYEHLTFSNSWCEFIQFDEMVKPKNSYDETISLNLAEIPRKYRGPHNKSGLIDENQLISQNRNYVLIGDPGSGKTTTLKRIARELLSEKQINQEKFFVPIVIRLRELETHINFLALIAEKLGMPYEEKKTLIKEIIASDVDYQSFFKRKKLKKSDEKIEYDYQNRTIIIEKEIVEIYVGNEKIETVLSEILNNSNALLILDGLDEAPQEKRKLLVKEIESINYYRTNFKTILTCRSGDFYQTIQGFDVIEICPLENSQKLEIAKKWLPDPDVFMEKIKNLPYLDLTDRPLFLNHLIIIFSNQGYLPDQPSTVYKRIIFLMLEHWDIQRGVKRHTKYSLLNPDRKLDFLSSLSYRLTYINQSKLFSENDLLQAYLKIHDDFRLPMEEGIKVVQEIESHTGLVVQNGTEYFEFSHLSLQEYLCAYYLVRAPFSKHLEDYLRVYPAPIAIAVSISSDPSEWFAKLILSSKQFPFITPESLSSFILRLVTEKPYFKYSQSLGLALLRICFVHSSPDISNAILFLLKDKYIEKSFYEALAYYKNLKNRDEKDMCYFVENFDLKTLGHGFAHTSGFLDKNIVKKMVS